MKKSREQNRIEIAAIHAIVHAAVVKNACPDCGGPLLRNTSMSGWYQCARGIRRDRRNKPYSFAEKIYQDEPETNCSWQGFTD